MGCAMKMKLLFSIGKYSFYWAGKGFLNRGVYCWNGKEHIRIIPLSKFIKPDEE